MDNPAGAGGYGLRALLGSQQLGDSAAANRARVRLGRPPNRAARQPAAGRVLCDLRGRAGDSQPTGRAVGCQAQPDGVGGGLFGLHDAVLPAGRLAGRADCAAPALGRGGERAYADEQRAGRAVVRATRARAGKLSLCGGHLGRAGGCAADCGAAGGAVRLAGDLSAAGRGGDGNQPAAGGALHQRPAA
jgi:hypothetical protein